MQYKLIVPGRLPNLNMYISALNKNRHVGNKLKQDSMELVGWHIKSQLRGVKIDKPVHIDFVWYETNKKRDIDGIASMGMKVIFDALQVCGTLRQDNWTGVKSFSHSFEVDKKDPRIEILIKEIEE